MEKEQFLFLSYIAKMEKGTKPIDEKIDIEKLILTPSFYKHLVKRGIIKDKQMIFKGYPIELDFNKHADIWGILGKRK